MPQKINGFVLFGMLLSVWMILGTGAYFTVGLTPPVRVVVFVVGVTLVAFGRRFLRVGPTPCSINSSWSKRDFFMSAVACWATALALLIAWDNRTLMSLRSIWNILPWWWVLLPTIAVLALIQLRKRSWQYDWPLTALVLGSIVGLPVLFFPLGSGFDIQLHEAALNVINQNGRIEPLTPYYIGYYVLVLIAHSIARIPIDVATRSLGPLLSAIFIAFALLYWTRNQKRNHATLLFILLPFTWSGESTPQHLAYLWSVLTVLSVYEEFPWLISIVFGLATLTIHPLSGIPIILFLIYFFLLKKRSLITRVSFFIVSALSVPLIFARLDSFTTVIKQWRFPTLGPLLKAPQEFNPFLDVLFTLVWNKWLLLLIPAAIIVVARKQRFELSVKDRAFLWAFAMCLTSAWLLGGIERFPNIITYETNNFSQRMLTMSSIFLLPLLVRVGSAVIRFLLSGHHASAVRVANIVIVTMVVAASVYTVVPITVEGYQVDKGYSISEGDLQATQWIHADGGAVPYIVLANQSVSAASVKQFGFQRYYSGPASDPVFLYPIPTGGVLYPYYLQFVYESPTRQTVEDAARVVNVDRAYVVINSYWRNALSLIRSAHKQSDAFYSTPDGSVWVFRFDRLGQSTDKILTVPRSK